MDSLFLTVLNMSITGAFVIAAAFLARLPLRKAPKIISYCLWAVVAFRLISPFAIESRLSLIPFSAEPISTQQALVPGQELNIGEAAIYSLQTPFDDVYVHVNPTTINPDLLPDPSGETRQITLAQDMLNKIYLGIPSADVYKLFGEPDYQASGLMWFGYNDIGLFDPSFSTTGQIERISLNNGLSWSVHDLIKTAVTQHNDGQFYTPAGVYHPTESHVILALDANPRDFTAYIMSLYMTFLPEGEYNVREAAGQHVPIALTFVKNQNDDYKLTDYWTAEEGNRYMTSIRSKFPESTWGLTDTQLYIQSSKQDCYYQAMYHFVGAIPTSGRFHIGEGTAVITNYAESLTPNDEFLIKYFPGATLSIEKYDEAFANHPPGSWIIEYINSNKNITVGRDGIANITITDDLIGILSNNGNKYAMKFEKYKK